MPIIAAESPNAVGADEFKATALGGIEPITNANPVGDGDVAIPAGSHLLIFPAGVPVGAWVDQDDTVHFAGSTVTVKQPDLLTSDTSGHLSGFATYLALPDDGVAQASSDATGELPNVEDQTPPVDDGSIPVDDGTDFPPVEAPDDTGTPPPVDTSGNPPPDQTGTGTPGDGTTPPVTPPPTTTTDDPSATGLVKLSEDFAAMVSHVGAHADQPTLLHDASALVGDAVGLFAQLLPHVDASPDAAAAAKALSDAFGKFIDLALDFPASGVPGAPGTPSTGSGGNTPEVPPTGVTGDPQPTHGGCGGWHSDHGNSMVASIASSH